MLNNHITVLEINLNAVEHNLNYFKSKLKNSTKTLAVIKAFGYGSDAIVLAKFLNDKVSFFAVAYVDEGIALREAGIEKPILVLHPQLTNFNDIIEHCLEPNIYSFKTLHQFISILKSKNIKHFPIHLKFNTGLNRLGFIPNDVEDLSSLLNNQKEVKVASLFSHIAASEDPNEKKFTLQQIHKFKTASEKLINKLNYTPIRHMLNTSGIVNYAHEAQFDMVRLGIGLYGFGNDDTITQNLKNVVTLKSVISQIHTVKKGESVGYNRAFIANKTTTSATIPVGHADGISRQLGNGKGYVYINNKKAPIIGNVCMDMIMVNVSNITCNEGDEVIIYKNQKHIEHLANLINSISYELLTAISQRIKRVIIKK
ncbi:MAG TPA: alanine racemase [Flavobacteriaceae bacterium]|nr:alanine racemase [Flavobacteriaceae bacterium]